MNNIGDKIDLSNYKQGEFFTAATDGYLMSNVKNGRLIYYIYGNTGSNYIYCCSYSPNTDYQYAYPTFIRKGMRVELRLNSSHGTEGGLYFFPLD